jgi:uroporphyrinogen III methyltransferase/synthase
MNEEKRSRETGKVYLVGAGPGDPGLITVRAMRLLGAAEVVLYDYLVNPMLLEYAAQAVEVYCLGQHGRTRIWTQDEINQQMVEFARQGKTVVRLKGGDPAVFGRAAEEVVCLERAGIPFEIVPGVTAGLAAASYAGIPLTHRDHASAVALVVGRECKDKQGDPLDYAALASFPGTIVMYMGVTTAATWAPALLDAGKPGDTPATIVRRCSFPDQTITRGTLAELPSLLSHHGKIRPPAIVVLGEVAGMTTDDWWFTSRPLFGATVLVTRPIDQSADLRNPLADLGAGTLVQPTIQIDEPKDWSPVDAAIARLADFDWIVFSSSNGASFFDDRLSQLRLDARALGGVKIAAIGPGTAKELAQRNLRADLMPDTYRAEALAKALSADASGQRFLLIRASRGREVLAEQLTAAGGVVEQIVCYESTDVEAPDEEIAKRLAEGKIDWITVTSSAIARSLVRLFGDDLKKARLASISPITSATLTELGHPPAVEARHYTMPGLVRSILEG